MFFYAIKNAVQQKKIVAQGQLISSSTMLQLLPKNLKVVGQEKLIVALEKVGGIKNMKQKKTASSKKTKRGLDL